MSKEFESHVAIAHTRWATHGPPSEENCHPHFSNNKCEFTVIHNGIITNSIPLRSLLLRKGYDFVSETDTESIAVLIQYIFDQKTDNGKTAISETCDFAQVCSKEWMWFGMVSLHYCLNVKTIRKRLRLLT